MEKQHTLFEIPVRPEDIVYTPTNVAESIVRWLNPKGKCLDPCKGDGAFYNYLPDEKDYCEIREGKDFFEYQQKVDWIIGNPPYSIFETFLQKSFSLADNVAFLVPTNKVFQRQIIMNRINAWGGIRSMIIYGSGQLLDFPFGFSVGLFHFQKNYRGDTRMVMGMQSVSTMHGQPLQQALVMCSCRCVRCGELHDQCLKDKMCYTCDNVTQGNCT